ncbi:uncharacterized protein [Rhodnius prolixus]|uniref:uncharacterized protein n=1 Tax=Rhodnius prolixus TaxID=13249 RepID=UPI003D188D65
MLKFPKSQASEETNHTNNEANDHTTKTIYSDEVICTITMKTSKSGTKMSGTVDCDRQEMLNKTKSKKKQVKKSDDEQDYAYDNKCGHIIIKSLVAGIRIIGAIIWCFNYTECEHSFVWHAVHLALPGFVPADIIVIVEFVVKRKRPYALPLMHDILGILFALTTSIMLPEKGVCHFSSKLTRLVPTTLIVCLLLQFFHIILFLATGKSM